MLVESDHVQIGNPSIGGDKYCIFLNQPENCIVEIKENKSTRQI